MNNEQAKECLINHSKNGDFKFDSELDTAIDLAIDALKYITNDTPKVSYNERWLAYQQRKPDNDGAEWRCNGAL